MNKRIEEKILKLTLEAGNEVNREGMFSLMDSKRHLGLLTLIPSYYKTLGFYNAPKQLKELDKKLTHTIILKRKYLERALKLLDSDLDIVLVSFNPQKTPFPISLSNYLTDVFIAPIIDLGVEEKFT